MTRKKKKKQTTALSVAIYGPNNIVCLRKIFMCMKMKAG